MTKPTSDAQLETLNSHYNETYKVVELVWTQRNRVALYLYLLSLALLTPELHKAAVEKLLGSEGAAALASPMILALGLIGLLAMCILYTQRTSFLDKHYVYLAWLERRMETLAGTALATREGKFYSALRASTPLPYHRFYDAVLLSLVTTVLIFVWWSVRRGGAQFGPGFIAVYLVLTYMFVYVLGMFFMTRERVRQSAQEINGQAEEPETVARPSREKDDEQGSRGLLVLTVVAGLLLVVLSWLRSWGAQTGDAVQLWPAAKAFVEKLGDISLLPRAVVLYTAALLLFLPLYLERMRVPAALIKRARSGPSLAAFLLLLYYLSFILRQHPLVGPTLLLTALLLLALLLTPYYQRFRRPAPAPAPAPKDGTSADAGAGEG